MGRGWPERHEGGMAERQLAAVSDEDVEAHDRDDEDQRMRPQAGGKAADHRGQTGEKEGDHQHQPGTGWGVADLVEHRGEHQTRRTEGRPKMPLGLTNNTPMMIARATASSRSPPTNGSAPARFTATPTSSPPTTAPNGLSIPPSTPAPKPQMIIDYTTLGSRK